MNDRAATGGPTGFASTVSSRLRRDELTKSRAKGSLIRRDRIGGFSSRPGHLLLPVFLTFPRLGKMEDACNSGHVFLSCGRSESECLTLVRGEDWILSTRGNGAVQFEDLIMTTISLDYPLHEF